ncbi:MAG TPA: hypothetical protein EYG94_00070 [Campylobacterales bacterium]|nr:hypothetical protein [Campylobacterales bacterium]
MAKRENPFEMFKTEEIEIVVESMGGATVKIKTALSVAEQIKLDELNYKNMGATDSGQAFFNPADASKSSIQAVSFLLIEPKMTVRELRELDGAEPAINEIYSAYLKQKRKSTEPKGK